MSLYDELETNFRELILNLKANQLDNDYSREIDQRLLQNINPPKIMILGEFNAGKSSIINALLGGDWLATDVLPTTSVVTVIRYHSTPYVRALKQDGTYTELLLKDFKHLTANDLDDSFLEKVEHYEVGLPISILHKFTFVDTPGLNSIYDQHTNRTTNFLSYVDEFIWVFLYGMIGRKSEVDSIKIIRQYDKLPTGIVNGIDLHYEMSDEPIEDLIEYEQFRLQDEVDGLIGISAKEYIEGIRHEDEELVDISNFQQLLDHLEKVNQSYIYKTFLLIEDFYLDVLSKIKLESTYLRSLELKKIMVQLLDKLAHDYKLELQVVLDQINNNKNKSIHLNIIKESIKSSWELRLLLDPLQHIEEIVEIIHFIDENDNIAAQYNNKFNTFVWEREHLLSSYGKKYGLKLSKWKHLFISKKTSAKFDGEITRINNEQRELISKKRMILSIQADYQSEINRLLVALHKKINSIKLSLYTVSKQDYTSIEQNISNLFSRVGIFKLEIENINYLRHIEHFGHNIKELSEQYLHSGHPELHQKLATDINKHQYNQDLDQLNELVKQIVEEIDSFPLSKQYAAVESELDYEFRVDPQYTSLLHECNLDISELLILNTKPLLKFTVTVISVIIVILFLLFIY